MKKNLFILALMMVAIMLASCVKDEVAPAPEPEPPPEPGELELVYYWHFNTMTGETVTEVPADFAAEGLAGIISYPGTGDGYLDARTHRATDPVSNYNLRMGQGPNQGAVLRARNPANTRELLVDIPSTGYHSLVVTYATTRSENGGQNQQFEYSHDGGTSWTAFGDVVVVPFIEEGGYAHVVLDLTEVEEVNDNPNLKFRFLSLAPGNDNPSGNQRFDNITLDAIAIE